MTELQSPVAKRIYKRFLEVIQEAEESGGPEGRDYVDLMTAIIREATVRIRDVHLAYIAPGVMTAPTDTSDLFSYLDRNCALIEAFSCFAAVSEDQKAVFYCPTMIDGTPERCEDDPRHLNWIEVTAPEPGFVEIVNDVFDTSFRYENFAGR